MVVETDNVLTCEPDYEAHTQVIISVRCQTSICAVGHPVGTPRSDRGSQLPPAWNGRLGLVRFSVRLERNVRMDSQVEKEWLAEFEEVRSR
jgi:hypothetical protein